MDLVDVAKPVTGAAETGVSADLLVAVADGVGLPLGLGMGQDRPCWQQLTMSHHRLNWHRSVTTPAPAGGLNKPSNARRLKGAWDEVVGAAKTVSLGEVWRSTAQGRPRRRADRYLSWS